MGSVFLFGTSHAYQRGRPDCSELEEAAFVSRIKQEVALISAAIICEEMSREIVESNGQTDSVPAKVASSLGMRHMYCDPGPSERVALGIRDVQSIQLEAWMHHWSESRCQSEIAAAFQKRELIWRDRLFSQNTWPVLFVCGANHVESFRHILVDSGLQVVVSEHDWAPN